MADYALQFNGSSQYVSFGNVLLSNTDVTATIHIKLTQNSSSNYDVVYGYGNTRWFLILLGSSSAVSFNIKIGGVEKTSGITSVLSLNTEYLFVGQYTASSGLLAVYVYDTSGNLVSSNSSTNLGGMDSTAQALQVAHDPARNFYAGMIGDGPRVYSRILTSAELVALAQKQYVNPVNLIGQWKFNEGSGATTADNVSTNNGTLVNTPTWVAGFDTVAPSVSTQAATSITQTSAVLNGTISDNGGANSTIRGFQYNTVPYADRDTSTTGSYSTGAFTATISNLSPGITYYARAYATNSSGTTYGSWISFAALAPTYSITINGVDRTTDILADTLIIEDVLNDQQNTCSFSLLDRNSVGVPSTDQEIIITLNDGSRLFAGKILTIKEQSVKVAGIVRFDFTCIDYVRLLDSNLVNKSYTNMTDAAIIADILTTYCSGFGITGTNVVSGVTISQITFNYLQPSQCFRKIADLTGRNWYIDYNKDVHYFPLTQTAAPFNITSSSNAYIDLTISKDASQLKNRVYVRGGTKLSDATTYQTKGDGVKRQFVLPDKPHSVSVAVNGVSKTLGIKNINLTGFDYYLNFEEKYLEQDSGAVILATTDTLTMNYSYDIPILVAVENTASIATNGQKEFAIFDKSITTSQAARDRASAELTDYANSIVEGTFRTFTNGFRSGQYININLSSYGVNDNYIITKVTATSFGAGNYVYDISIASAKTMGVIRFLIELLEANKNLIELSSSEVVDNLLSATDSLSTDSLTDVLTIDSAGGYSTWCPDSIVTTPTTRARWDLFQWM